MKPTPIPEALRLLREAYDLARDLRQSVWDFAVELPTLRSVGLTDSHVRWLTCKGYVEHATETSSAKSEVRNFQREAKLRLTRRTCVVLTTAGVAFAGGLGCPETRLETASGKRLPDRRRLKPRWDQDRRQLHLGQFLVKQFRQRATNQELILAALQEEGWPPHLDDPLPPTNGIVSKRRLHDTIQRLNQNQKHALVRFHGDGRGRGVLWELRTPSRTRVTPERR